MKNIVLNQITLCADGSIGIQWLKQIIDPDTGEVVHSEPHRSVVDFDGDAEAQLGAVFDHLDALKFKVPNSQRNRMKLLVGKIDAIAKADTEITARRQAKLAAKAAAAAAGG